MRRYKAKKGELIFRIEEDLPEIGAYLRVYKNNHDIRDHLQDAVELCKEYALEEYGVPLSSWEEYEDVS